ncbi:mercuric transporter MerT family protein [Ancylomarina longa]|uniref:Mercuric transport protein MerT n=1 Tax=Ancylomarina longa TaxID=2487017 RepID=A0A434AFY3_9BACT|nr:mercuric transporter MerT family protein [Ancylomarina longa]RUT73311.1 mercury transporter [Ancylomarina longa]
MAGFKLKKKTSIGTAVFSAVSLKLCCWGPLLLTGVAGVSGSSVYFSWFITLKPYLLTIAFLSLGYAFYQVYKPKKTDCNCETDKKVFFKSKLYVWLVAVFVILMTLTSYFPQLFYQSQQKEVIIIEQSNIDTIKFDIEGMTCSGCEENINHSVNKFDGILEINTSHKRGTSEIKFDKINYNEIEKAIKSKGYVIKNSKK